MEMTIFISLQLRFANRFRTPSVIYHLILCILKVHEANAVFVKKTVTFYQVKKVK